MQEILDKGRICQAIGDMVTNQEGNTPSSNSKVWDKHFPSIFHSYRRQSDVFLRFSN